MSLIVHPTIDIRPPAGGAERPRLFITVGVELPDGFEPESTFRGTSVGVGGKHFYDSLGLGLGGGPVRRATGNEMRRMARARIAAMLERYPEGKITVRRSRHY